MTTRFFAEGREVFRRVLNLDADPPHCIFSIDCSDDGFANQTAQRLAVLLTIAEGISTQGLRKCIIAARPAGAKWKR